MTKDNPNQTYNYDKFISLLRLPQVKQGTDYWLEKRHNIVSASVVGTVLGIKGPAAYNILLSDKVNRESSFFGSFATHWGNKYEAVVDMIYEYLYGKKIHELGLIIHPKYDFIGASTDGVTEDLINIEIKSPVSRTLDHLPLEYWAQMQLQMEVLDLYITHFVEVRFNETDLVNSSLDMTSIHTIPHIEDDTEKINNAFGLIIEYFCLDKCDPEYIYSPVCPSNSWLDVMIKTFTVDKNRIFLRVVKWTIDDYKKTNVLRDKEWFRHSLPIFEYFNGLLHHYRKIGGARFNYELKKCRNVKNDNNICNKKTTGNDKDIAECVL